MSVWLSVDACRDLQSVDIGTYLGRKIVTQAWILKLIK
jgi:hypothetical protein